MAFKKHLRLSNKQLGETSKVKFNYGFDTNEEDDRVENPNYYYMALALQSSMSNFFRDLELKYAKRSGEINIPASVDYIKIDFVDQFDIDGYSNNYYYQFGLEAINFSNYNRQGLFAVEDRSKFDTFKSNVNSFIDSAINKRIENEYSSYIKYIKNFALLTSEDILKFNLEELGKVVYVKLMDLPLNAKLENALIKALEEYLINNNISYHYLETENRLELIEVTGNQLLLLAENFDIIKSITCSISSVIKPSTLNFVKREYGFEINNAEEDLPIIGIIDTGISISSPLAPIIIRDNEFSIAGDPFIDEAGMHRLGHGTAIAGLASLGHNNHFNKFEGTINADAKLLSIKISDKSQSYIPESELIKMLYKACEKYPKLKIFVLTMCYSTHKKTNEDFSDYTYALDKFAYDTGSLIFICTGNNNNVINEISDYNYDYFEQENTNLCSPADSLNNIVVGAAAENLNNNRYFGISPGREYPTMYTRKSHFNLKKVYPKNKTNKNYFKPDIIDCGGDIGSYTDQLDWTDEASIFVLSARPEMGFVFETGTSLSAPLVANIAAKLLRIYPNINTQSIKALLINSACKKNIKFPDDKDELKKNIIGHGQVDISTCLFSTQDSVTCLLEDTIETNELKIYPINFPDYLAIEDLGKKQGVLKLTATLCFSFNPIQNHQLSYNPVHMAFCFFKNQTASEIVRRNDDLNSKIKGLTWSQNGRHVSKPLPYANTQKLALYVDVKNLIDENCTLKLAIQCKLTNQIIGGVSDEYPREFPFSIVIKVEENLKNNTGKLYDELQAVNYLESIASIDLEGIIA